MNLDIFRSPPHYRKLLLENKILILFAMLLLGLGMCAIAATHWAVVREAEILGVDDAGFLPSRAATIVGLLMLAPLAIVLLGARSIVRRAIRPLKELTRVADRISMGDLDPEMNFGVTVNCWEIKNCGQTDCRAYMNLSEQCWYVDGTPCKGYEPRFPAKLVGCRKCEVYQMHRGDEIVQLADSFRHMTGVIKASREELVKSDEFQKRLIRNSFDGIIATNEQDCVTIFNRVAERLTGYDPADIVGTRRWRDIFEPGIEKWMDKPLSYDRKRRLRGMAPRESVLRIADGGEAAVRLSGIMLYEDGVHLGKVFFFQDMREIKCLREDLIRGERLAATGQAAAGISHSIKNILDGFRGGAYIFKQGKRAGHEQKMDRGWEMIERNVEIISNLVEDLINFSKVRVPQYELTDPVKLLRDVIAATGLDAATHAKIRVVADDLGESVELDRGAFHQCLGNLLCNAADAIPSDRGGEITVGVERAEGHARFCIQDDGVGMSPETITRVLGGMYSTKGSKGTGLGLLVVQKIVAEHGGTLTIESEVGRGSTFRVAIPLRQPAGTTH